ncbi:hypothetical protein ACH5RR_023928 [Cinchona calisaya]|uniref:PI3K/PI4K catalytic domain-containing protein n=1 Tax=Cinchona calisaya TaxID=153742 RepID=A0ABD2ZC23_9GENT
MGSASRNPMHEGVRSGNKTSSTSQACEREDTSLESGMFSMLESISTFLDSLANQTERRLHVIKGKMDAVDARVGYIVRLGDRHSMNKIIDQATAKVVHIDLGVAFEPSLMLKTPERETDDVLETSMEGSEKDEYERNKDAARALLCVK